MKCWKRGGRNKELVSGEDLTQLSNSLNSLQLWLQAHNRNSQNPDIGCHFLQAPPLPEELLQAENCEKKGNHSFLRLWLLFGLSSSNRWSHTHEPMGSTNQT